MVVTDVLHFWQLAIVPLSRSAALPILPHSGDLTEVFGAAFGRLLAANATGMGGNQGILDGMVAMGTFEHTRSLKQGLL